MFRVLDHPPQIAEFPDVVRIGIGAGAFGCRCIYKDKFFSVIGAVAVGDISTCMVYGSGKQSCDHGGENAGGMKGPFIGVSIREIRFSCGVPAEAVGSGIAGPQVGDVPVSQGCVGRDVRYAVRNDQRPAGEQGYLISVKSAEHIGGISPDVIFFPGRQSAHRCCIRACPRDGTSIIMSSRKIRMACGVPAKAMGLCVV